MRKLYYNLAITGISVVIAILVGAVEALSLAAETFGLEGGFWAGPSAATAHWTAFGYIVIAIFTAAWVLAVAIYRAIDWAQVSDPHHL